MKNEVFVFSNFRIHLEQVLRSNNYLKMHHFPMRRKKTGKKRKHKQKSKDCIRNAMVSGGSGAGKTRWNIKPAVLNINKH